MRKEYHISMESIVFQEWPALGSKIVVQSFSPKSDVKKARGLGRERAPDHARDSRRLYNLTAWNTL